MHVTVVADGGLTSELIHFTTSLLITSVLLVLTLRAARLPGTPAANILFAVCGILWSAGGLSRFLLLSASFSPDAAQIYTARAVQYSGAAVFPIAILAVWRPFARPGWQKTASRVLQVCAGMSAAIIIGLLCWRQLSPSGIMRATALNAGIVLTLGAGLTLRRHNTPRTIYLPSLAIVAALAVAALMLLPRKSEGLLTGAAAHLILLMVLCTFLLFARFRYADRFIRYAVRILLAAFWAGFLSAVTTAPTTSEVMHRAAFPSALHGFLMVLSVNVLLFSIAFVDTRVAKAVNRWLFRAPDYRGETRALGARLRDLDDEQEIGSAVEEATRRPLELNEARLTVLDSTAPHALLEGETVESGDTVLIPVSSGGRVTHLLAATPGSTRPGLVSSDVDYLRAVAALYGNRIDALAREREAIELQSREAVLLQQVTEAELRALRAQINPHFLFNSLNTVADLIVRDPARAETMTLRLASVFRHVLAHAARPLTTVRDEVDFLRAYLYIEEARFGDRLRVEISVAADVAGEEVPSLILQPLVENALKHGLGPKPGPGCLSVSACAEGDLLRLRVEDDGLGLGARRGPPGVGLANVRDRLATLYQGRANIQIEAREGGGCRATVWIPRSQAATG